MTEKLKTLMDRAADVDFDAVDLATITADGDRALRRRRLVVGLAGVAAAAVTVAVLVAVDGGTRARDDKPPVVDSGQGDSAGMSWAIGAQLHTPTTTIDVGRPVRAYVPTSAGFVTADDEGRIWSVVGGKVTALGQGPAEPRLVSDPEEARAAWLAKTDQGWQVVVHDQALGRRLRTVAADEETELVSLDAGELYVRQGDRYRVFDVDGTDAWEIGPPEPDANLLAVEDGAQVWSAGDHYLVARDATAPVRIDDVAGQLAVLSPDGRRVSFDADELRVFDTVTGERLAFEVDGRVFASGYQWLDGDSLAVIASRTEQGPVELLVCEMENGRCDQVVPDLGTFDEVVADGFALPIGTGMED